MDERYATFREHAELRERTATLEATIHQIGPALARIEQAVVTIARQPAVDHSALAAHRVLDDLPQLLQTASQKTQGASPVLMAFALIGALAIGALGYKLFTGG